ncbi:Protein of unknown function [Cotesia congregata]|uniref:Uncharacterized protein n=1 Tax=Cotesia congregata TaxID=51543 RepID=A0A8J2H7R2_COTCN|nr:Protein of unknown function [Cotesia congregata]
MAAAGYRKTLSVALVRGLRLIIIKRDETCENEDTFDSEAVFDTELALAANQNDRLPRSEANRARGAGKNFWENLKVYRKFYWEAEKRQEKGVARSR